MLARKITLAQDLERIRGDLGLTVGRSDGRTRRVRTATAEEVPYGRRRRLRASSPSTTREPLRTAAAAGVVALHRESTRAGGFLCRRGGEEAEGAKGGCKKSRRKRET